MAFPGGPGISQSPPEAFALATTLLPANVRAVRQFAEPDRAGAEQKIAPQIVQPAECAGAQPSKLLPLFGADHSQGAAFPKTAPVSLGRTIIVRVHDDRFRAVDHVIALLAAPAGVFVILGVLHLLKETAPCPNVFAQAAAGYAEKMIPAGGLTACSETKFVIGRIDRAAIRPGNLPTEDGGGARIEQRSDQRAHPLGALGSRVRVEKNCVRRFGQLHAGIHDTAGIIFLRFD